jgi:hypothetical protein
MGRVCSGVSLLNRNVGSQWRERTPRDGDFKLVYPRPAPAVFEHVWRGILRVPVGPTGGTVAGFSTEAEGRTLCFRITWP